MFCDARKQDAIDVLTGQYVYGPMSKSLLKRETSYMWLQMGLLFAVWTLVQVSHAVHLCVRGSTCTGRMNLLSSYHPLMTH